MGLNLNGLRFDMKRFFEGKLEREAEMRERAAVLPAPTAADLAAIELSEDDLADFRFLGEGDIEDDALKGRMRALYEKELRQALMRIVMLATYGGLLVGAVLAQGGMAWYYATRAKHVREHAASTPEWVARVQRMAA